MKQTILNVAIILFSFAASAEPAVIKVENIFSCSMMDGYLTHNMSQYNGVFTASFAFPTYLKNLTDPEEIAKKRQEWKDWDGVDESTRPEDSRKISFAVPLQNNNILSNGQNLISNRAKFFESIFPDMELARFLPIDKGRLFLTFKDKDCFIAEGKGFMSATCQTDEPTVINDISIDKIIVNMSNQKVSELSPDPNNPPSLTPRTKNTVQANIIFIIGENNYTSSFTYSPNGDDRQCMVRDFNLPEFDN